MYLHRNPRSPIGGTAGQAWGECVVSTAATERDGACVSLEAGYVAWGMRGDVDASSARVYEGACDDGVFDDPSDAHLTWTPAP